MKVAIIEKTPSKVQWDEFFPTLHKVGYDVLFLCSDANKKRILKSDIELDIDFVKECYDYIILVGAEAAKHVAKISSVTSLQGHLCGTKFIPLSSPIAASLRPESKPAFDIAVERVNAILSSNTKAKIERNLKGVQEYGEALSLLRSIKQHKVLCVDTETDGLYPKNANLLGVSIAWDTNNAAYLDASCLYGEAEEELVSLLNSSKCIFHNAKFDLAMLNYTFTGIHILDWEDTMLLHYCLDERQGTHGLKDLALRWTDLGDYDRPLEEFKSSYCRINRIKKSEFNYSFIPFNIMYEYAALDVIATMELYHKFHSSAEGEVYNLLKRGVEFILKMEKNGVPFDKDRLIEANTRLEEIITKALEELFSYKEIKEIEEEKGKPFNVNSPVQLRELLFNKLQLEGPGKLTESGLLSTDKEVMAALAEQHPIVDCIQRLRKSQKIKSTYIIKILKALDRDNRLRTNFNITGTTSGRLSSSGRLNMQNIPRDDKTVKFCIKAREGYAIVSQDLVTAEMQVAAVLSKDKELQRVFIEGHDFHSAIAHKVFKLPCAVEDVKKVYPELRQRAKAISFGILYGAGAAKVAEQADCSLEEAQEAIDLYFDTYKYLADWLRKQKEVFKTQGYARTVFGRIRRVPNVFSSNKGIAAHAVRSGVNSLIQSPASDINLMAAIEMQDYIEDTGMDAKIFALVHDSIIAEVKLDQVTCYCETLKELTQKDRGCSIPGTPIGVDVEVGEDYSFFVKELEEEAIGQLTELDIIEEETEDETT